MGPEAAPLRLRLAGPVCRPEKKVTCSWPLSYQGFAALTRERYHTTDKASANNRRISQTERSQMDLNRILNSVRRDDKRTADTHSQGRRGEQTGHGIG